MQTPIQPVRWSLKVSAETDIELRTYLAQQGMRKGDLSKFVEEAVQRALFLRMLDEVQTHNSDASSDDIEQAITHALRSERARIVAAAAT